PDLTIIGSCAPFCTRRWTAFGSRLSGRSGSGSRCTRSAHIRRFSLSRWDCFFVLAARKPARAVRGRLGLRSAHGRHILPQDLGIPETTVGWIVVLRVGKARTAIDAVSRRCWCISRRFVARLVLMLRGLGSRGGKTWKRCRSLLH